MYRGQGLRGERGRPGKEHRVNNNRSGEKKSEDLSKGQPRWNAGKEPRADKSREKGGGKTGERKFGRRTGQR